MKAEGEVGSLGKEGAIKGSRSCVAMELEEEEETEEADILKKAVARLWVYRLSGWVSGSEYIYVTGESGRANEIRIV